MHQRYSARCRGGRRGGFVCPIGSAKNTEQVLRVCATAAISERILDPSGRPPIAPAPRSYLVYSTLFVPTIKTSIKPQMVDQTIVSDDGMKNTRLRYVTVFLMARWKARVVEGRVEVAEARGKGNRLGQLLMRHTAKISAVNRTDIALVACRTLRLVLEALGKTGGNVPFICPQELQRRHPEDQIKEVIGSGPFKFAKDDWKPANRSEYLGNSEIIDAAKRRNGSTAGKRAFLDRIIWRYIRPTPDAGSRPSAGRIDSVAGAADRIHTLA